MTTSPPLFFFVHNVWVILLIQPDSSDEIFWKDDRFHRYKAVSLRWGMSRD